MLKKLHRQTSADSYALLLALVAIVATWFTAIGCHSARDAATDAFVRDVGAVLSGSRAPATLSPADQLRWERARDATLKLREDLRRD